MLDLQTPRGSISRAARSSIDHTVGQHRVDIGGVDADWTAMSVPKVLEYLIAESPNFKRLISDVLLCAGAHENLHEHATPCLSCGDHRRIYMCVRLHCFSSACYYDRCKFEADPLRRWNCAWMRIGTRQPAQICRVVFQFLGIRLETFIRRGMDSTGLRKDRN